MNKNMKLIALIALLLYVVSPMDAVPGPVDDMILCLVYAFMNYKGFGIGDKRREDRRTEEYYGPESTR